MSEAVTIQVTENTETITQTITENGETITLTVNEAARGPAGSAASSDVAAAIHAATAVTVPEDADECSLVLSPSWGLRKITWANIKAWVKAFLGTAAQQDVGYFATAAQGTDERVPTAVGIAAKVHAASSINPPLSFVVSGITSPVEANGTYVWLDESNGRPRYFKGLRYNFTHQEDGSPSPYNIWALNYTPIVGDPSILFKDTGGQYTCNPWDATAWTEVTGTGTLATSFVGETGEFPVLESSGWTLKKVVWTKLKTWIQTFCQSYAAALNSPQAAATPSIRALGTGATDAMPGDNTTFANGVSAGGMTLTEVLGTELIQDGGFADPTTYWTGATGWTFPTGLARHDAAGTGTLVPKAGSPLLAAATVGTVYKIQYTASVWTVAGMTVSFGGTIGQTSTFPNANGVYTCYVKATTVANLVLTPLTGGRFSIDNLSVKAVLSGGATGGGLIQHPSGESHLYADAAAKDAARTAMGAYGAGDAPAFAGLETSGFIGAPSTSCGMKIKPDDGNVSFFRANTCLTAINYYGFLAGNGTSFGWSSGGPANANPDTSMWRKSAGLVSVGTGTTPGAIDGSMQFLNLTLGGTLGVTGAATVTGLLTANGNIAGQEVTAPAAPAANKYIIFAEDNGAGKTRLMVQFATGAAQQIAIEP